MKRFWRKMQPPRRPCCGAEVGVAAAPSVSEMNLRALLALPPGTAMVMVTRRGVQAWVFMLPLLFLRRIERTRWGKLEESSPGRECVVAQDAS